MKVATIEFKYDNGMIEVVNVPIDEGATIEEIKKIPYALMEMVRESDTLSIEGINNESVYVDLKRVLFAKCKVNKI